MLQVWPAWTHCHLLQGFLNRRTPLVGSRVRREVSNNRDYKKGPPSKGTKMGKNITNSAHDGNKDKCHHVATHHSQSRVSDLPSQCCGHANATTHSRKNKNKRNHRARSCDSTCYHDNTHHKDTRNTRNRYRDNSTHSHRSKQDHRSSVQPNRARREQDHANTQRRARSVDHESVQFNNRDNRDRERKLGEEHKKTGISREILKNRYDNRHHHFDDDNFSIQLTAKNMCLGNVKDTTFIVVVDSGATHDIITQTTINGSPYLSSLEPTPCESISFTVAGGEHIQCKTKLKFDLSIQGVTFAICAYIMPDCGSVSMLLGTETLNALQGQLDFSKHTLTVKSRRIRVKATRKQVIRPHEKREITFFAHGPGIMKNAPAIINFSNFMCKHTVPVGIVQFHRGKCRVPVYNDTDQAVYIDKNSTVGNIDIDSSFSVLRQAPVAPPGVTADKQGQVFSLRPTEGTKGINRKHLKANNMHKFKHLEESDPRLSMTDREIIEKYVDLNPTDTQLSSEEVEEFQDFLHKNKEAFSLHDEVGDSGEVVDFKLVNDTPFFIRPYSCSEADKVLIDKHMTKLVHLGIVKPGMSGYTSPILLVDKKGTNEKRVCADLRHANTLLPKINFLFGLVKDSMQTIGASESTIFTSLDLKDAFYTLRLSERSKKFFCVGTYPGGRTFIYQRLIQGSSISAQMFSNFMEKVLADIPDAAKYVLSHADDLICFSKSKEEHQEHLANILHALIKHGLKLSPKKAHFFRKSLVYMGHVITVKDNQPHIQVLRSRVDAIDRIKQPTTPKQVKSFIGTINYLSMFLPRITDLLKPLYELTKKGVKFKWEEKHQASFNKLKSLLKEAPTLATPRKHGKFVLMSDTSKHSVGAALYQYQDNQLRLLGYYSRALPAAAASYGISELEGKGLCLAIDAFQNLLKGNHFEAVVDHSALIHIVKAKREPPTMRLKKIVEKLSGYNFDLRHIPGRLLRLPDYLSRNCSPEDLNELLKSTSENAGQISFKQRNEIISAPIALTANSLDDCDLSTELTNCEDKIICENSCESLFTVQTRSKGSTGSSGSTRVTRNSARSKGITVQSDLNKYPIERKKRTPKTRARSPTPVIAPLPTIDETEEDPTVLEDTNTRDAIHTRSHKDTSEPEIPIDIPRTSLTEIRAKTNIYRNSDSFEEQLAKSRQNLSTIPEVEHHHTSDIPSYKFNESKALLPRLTTQGYNFEKIS